MEDFFRAVHIGLVVFMLAIPFLPLHIIRKGFLFALPAAMYASHLLFNGCPISRLHPHVNECALTRRLFQALSGLRLDCRQYKALERLVVVLIPTIVCARCFARA